MKIIAIWIENYRCIKQKLFVFDNSYSVDLITKDGVILDVVIQEKDTVNIGPLLYGRNISIEAIVGNNGAGKSTLLNAIREVLVNDTKAFNGFIILADQNYFVCIGGEAYEKVKINGEARTRQQVNGEPDLIYYSDLLEPETTSLPLEGTAKSNINHKDVSTIKLLRESCSKKLFPTSRIDSLKEYFHFDLIQQFDLVKHIQEEKIYLPFLIPGEISIFLETLKPLTVIKPEIDWAYPIEYPFTEHFPDVLDSYDISAFAVLIRFLDYIYEKKVVAPHIWNDMHEIYFYCVDWNIFLGALIKLLDLRQLTGDYEEDFLRIDKVIQKYFPLDFFKRYPHTKKAWDNYRKELETRMRELIAGEDILSEYHEFLKINDLGRQSEKQQDSLHGILYLGQRWKDRLHERWDIELSQIIGKSEFVIEYILQYDKLFYAVKFMSFSWNMSSGEQSMFNILARLHNAITRNPVTKSHILLLDELDNTFHPAWQQSILNQLIRFLSIVYPEHEFQILLTTHSPVLLSDVPKSNVIFMKRDGIETGHSETFAANIADLYYDSFFMENGSIGDVSKKTIVNLFKAIQKYEDDPEHPDPVATFGALQFPDDGSMKELITVKDIEALINSIGEEIWRNKLREKYERYFSKQSSNIMDELYERVRKLTELNDQDAVKNIIGTIDSYLEEQQ